MPRFEPVPAAISKKDIALGAIADALCENCEEILAANKIDLENGEKSGLTPSAIPLILSLDVCSSDLFESYRPSISVRIMSLSAATNPNAKKLDIIEKINAEIFEMAAGTGSNRGTGGMITKLQAADYATKRGVEVNVINGSNPENLYEVIDGNKIGTKFLPVK